MLEQPDLPREQGQGDRGRETRITESRSPPSGGMCFSVPATVRVRRPYSASRNRTRTSITRRNSPTLSARPSSPVSSGTLQERNTRYGHIPSAVRGRTRGLPCHHRGVLPHLRALLQQHGRYEEGCRTPTYAPDQAAYQGLLGTLT